MSLRTSAVDAADVPEKQSPTIADVYNLMVVPDVVTATKTLQPVEEAPAVITVITSEQIRLRGYSSVGEALQAVYGVDVINDYAEYNAGVRGINSGMRAHSRVFKVMINGQPVSFRSSSENWLGESLIPIDAVERIEIIRGPVSALYGANAFLGIINVITKNGPVPDDPDDEVNLSLISAKALVTNDNPGGGGSLVLHHNTKFTSAMLAAAYSYVDRSGLSMTMTPQEDGISYSDTSQNDVAEPFSAYGRLERKTRWPATLAIDFSVQRLKTIGEYQSYSLMQHNNQIDLYSGYLRLMMEAPVNEHFTLYTSLAYAHGQPTAKEKLTTYLPESSAGDWITRDLGFQAMDMVVEGTIAFDRHNELRLGYDLTMDNENFQTTWSHFESEDGIRSIRMHGSRGRGRMDNLGFYGQLVLYPFQASNTILGQNLSLTGGLRADIHSLYGTHLNYRAGLVFAPDPLFFVKLLLGSSYKAPPATQLHTTLMVSEDLLENPELKPETADTLELNLGTDIRSRFSLQGTFFLSHINNKVEIVPYNYNIQAQNISKSKSLGGELETVLRVPDRLEAFVNTSYQKTNVEEEAPFDNLEYDARLYPSWMVKSGVTLLIPEIFMSLYVEGRYTGERIASSQNIRLMSPYTMEPYSLDDYFVLDTAISTLNLRIFGQRETFIIFKISNVFGASYQYPGFATKVKYDVPGEERSYMIRITQEI